MNSPANILYYKLINEEKLNNIINFSNSDYENDLIYFNLKLPHDTLSKCRGISIKIHKKNGYSGFETLLISHSYVTSQYDPNSIFDAGFMYDPESGYICSRIFIEINDLVDEIIRVHNFYGTIKI